MEICLTCYILMYVKNIKNVFTFTSVLENMVKIQKRKKKKKKKTQKTKKENTTCKQSYPFGLLTFILKLLTFLSYLKMK